MKIIKLTNTEKVKAYIDNLEDFHKEICSLTRETILSTDSSISEEIKWNSPCFYFNGEIENYIPKEYKRELIVFNIHKRPYLLLVFTTGAKISDPLNFLEGEYKDGRRLLKIYSLEDLKSKELYLQSLIKDWLTKINK
jgi:hypothetical protein